MKAGRDPSLVAPSFDQRYPKRRKAVAAGNCADNWCIGLQCAVNEAKGGLKIVNGIKGADRNAQIVSADAKIVAVFLNWRSSGLASE